MIQKFIDRFLDKKEDIRAILAQGHPENYKDIVKIAIKHIGEPDENYGVETPDPEKIHEINDGDYQGTLVFVIAAKGYQPSDYWYVMVDYGSCSGCDTLDGIKGYGHNEVPNDEQINDYMTLILHVVEGLKKMG